MEPSPFVRLCLLGDFSLQTRRGEALRVARSAQRVLALLATRHDPVGRATASAALWPDSGQDRAGACLRSAVWRLPRPDGRTLVDGDLARLRLAGHVTVDYAADDLTIDELNLDLLPEWDDDWLIAERERFRQRRLHLMESHARWHLANRNYDSALRAALAAVAAEPLRESAHRLVIQTHLAEANPAEALRHYRTCARLLRAELGIRPAPPTRALVRHLVVAASA